MQTSTPCSETTTSTTVSSSSRRLGQRELFLLQPDVVFLNHGSFGACPREVFETYQYWQLELEHQPVDFIQRRLRPLLGDAREALGRYIGAPADDVVYVTNATMGMNIVAHSVPLEPGDEVLTTDQEYGAINNIWEFVCNQRGARYVRQQVPLPCASAEEIVEAVWAGVSARTRVLSISHITSSTALILPVKELVRRARERGIITVIDGAHAAGQIPLDMESLGADFYVGNCHKWMMSPKGAGFLYARPQMQGMLQPLVVSHAMHRSGELPCFVNEQQYQGTRDPAAFLSVPAAIAFAEKHDWAAVRSACHDLLCDARRRIAALTGLCPPTPDTWEWIGQMGIAPIPSVERRGARQQLWEAYHIEIPITGYGDQRCLRISVQGYNSVGDINALVAAVGELLLG